MKEFRFNPSYGFREKGKPPHEVDSMEIETEGLSLEDWGEQIKQLAINWAYGERELDEERDDADN